MTPTWDQLIAALRSMTEHSRGPAQDTTMAKPRPPKKPKKGKYRR